MINRDSRGDWYSIVRGEILGFIEDQLLRKHFSRMFSLISERKLGDRRRSKPFSQVGALNKGPLERRRYLVVESGGMPAVHPASLSVLPSGIVEATPSNCGNTLKVSTTTLPSKGGWPRRVARDVTV